MAEAKLDIAGDTEKAQRAIDALTRKLAQANETMRKMAEQSKTTTNSSVKDIDRWASGMQRLTDSQDKWKQGLERIHAEHAKIKRDADLSKPFEINAQSVGMLAAKVTTLGAIASGVY